MGNQFKPFVLFKKQHIPFSETGYFSQIISDYLSGDAQLRPFYEYQPDISSFPEIIRKKSLENLDRSLLVQVLKDQYQNLPMSGVTAANIQALNEQTTFCCTTAHQLNICTGPLYIIYKTLSVIALCNRINQDNPTFLCVPVFWLGSEDHDVAEVDHLNLFGKKLQWKTDQKGPVGRMSTTGMEEVLKELDELLGNSADVETWKSHLRDAYSNELDMRSATRRLLNSLFGAFGLVVVDGDHKDLKAQCRDIIQDELLQNNSATLVHQTTEKLSQLYPAQAHPRDINLFYMVDGQRERIVSTEEGYSTASGNQHWTKTQMEALLETHPEHFSPNVILRPLFQQKVLPSLAYVGGGGELAYWFQLRELFAFYSVDFPMLVLRNSLVVIDKVAGSKMDKLGIEVADVFQKEESLVKKYIDEKAGDELNLASEISDIENLFQHLKEKAAGIDPTLSSSVEAEMANVLKSIERVRSRMVKAEKNKHEVALNQIKSMKQKLFPNGSLQERHDNISSLIQRFGLNFIEELLPFIEPLPQNFTILMEDQG